MNYEKYVFHYIESNGFEQILENESNKEQLLKEHTEEILKEFVEYFWKNPKTNIVKLKRKLKIAPSIGYKDIVVSFPTPIYIELLNEVWSENADFSKISKKYNVDLKRIDDLLLKIPYIDDSVVCNECLESSEFYIDIDDLKNPSKILVCSECHKEINGIDELLDVAKAEMIKAKKNQEHKDFETLVAMAEQKLSDCTCHKCDKAQLKLIVDRTKMQYKVCCNHCQSLWDTVTLFERDNAEFKQRSAMMIAIKQRNVDADILGEIKNQPVKKEEFITLKDTAKVVYKYRDYEAKDEMSALLFEGIKKTNRIEKLLLISLIKVLKEKHEVRVWTINPEKVTVSVLGNSKMNTPILNYISDKTNFLNVRAIVRGLLDKYLVVCDEEANRIEIHPLLLSFEDNIKKLLTPQNILQDIKYLVIKRNNYTCWHCGETGRPLKVSYLNKDKDINRLDTIVAICDICYENITMDDVIISSTSVKFEDEQSFSLAYRLLTDNIPEFKGQTDFLEVLEEITEKYGEENTIKALVISINKSKNGGLTSLKSIFDYTYGILNNTEDEVYVSKKIADKYNLDEYLSKI